MYGGMTVFVASLTWMDLLRFFLSKGSLTAENRSEDIFHFFRVPGKFVLKQGLTAMFVFEREMDHYSSLNSIQLKQKL